MFLSNTCDPGQSTSLSSHIRRSSRITNHPPSSPAEQEPIQTRRSREPPFYRFTESLFLVPFRNLTQSRYNVELQLQVGMKV